MEFHTKIYKYLGATRIFHDTVFEQRFSSERKTFCAEGATAEQTIAAHSDAFNEMLSCMSEKMRREKEIASTAKSVPKTSAA